MSEVLSLYRYEKIQPDKKKSDFHLEFFTSSANSIINKSSLTSSDDYFGNSYTRSFDRRAIIRLLRRSRMSRSSSADVVNTISIVSGTADKDINEVSDMPSAVSLTSTPQVAPSPAHSRITENSDSAPDTPDSSTTCSWCGRTGGTWEPGSSLSCATGITSNAGRFCSEACFAAGRRAAFKRARTCDWCRHLRHSVSYVDFQDGENQLQFCSDKCLNQYKMNIFCRETQAYLALHGLTSISPSSNQSIGDGLITPELWMRDCHTPQSSSFEDEALVVDDEPMNWSSDCGLENEEKEHYQGERLASQNNSTIQNSPVQALTCKSEEKDSENSSVQDFHEETIKWAIKESLKDEEYRRYKQRKDEMDSFKSFSACVESRIPMRLVTTSKIVKPCRSSTSSPESLKASPPSSNAVRKNTIFIKDVRKLLRRDLDNSRNSIHQAQCKVLTNNTMNTPHNTAAATNKLPVSFHPQSQITPPHQFPRDFYTANQSFIPHQMPLRFNSNPRNFSIPLLSSPNIDIRPRLPIHSFRTKIPETNPPLNLLPPVTVVVPYPIPIPIPLPIPIPQSLFEKFFKSKDATAKKNDSSSNLENSAIPHDLSQPKSKNLQSCPCEQNTSLTDKPTLLESLSFSPPAASSSLNNIQPSFSPYRTNSSEATSVSPVLSFTSTENLHKSRSLRKKKHPDSQGEIDLRIKRKNKFVPV